jgi:hypothetical protein
VLDSNFMIDLEPYLSVVKEIKVDEYSIPVYLVDVNKLINAIITKVAQTTALCTKYKHNPARMRYFIKVFNALNDYSIEALNSTIQKLLKYKDLGLNLLLYPIVVKKDNTEYALVKWYLNQYMFNDELIYRIIGTLVESEIAYYSFRIDDEYIYFHGVQIDGNKVVNGTEIKYESLYPIEIKFIDYLIKQGMKEPKNISIKEDNGKYLISWEY